MSTTCSMAQASTGNDVLLATVGAAARMHACSHLAPACLPPSSAHLSPLGLAVGLDFLHGQTSLACQASKVGLRAAGALQACNNSKRGGSSLQSVAHRRPTPPLRAAAIDAATLASATFFW